MVRLWWTCLAIILCVESVTPRESNGDLTAIIKDLQVQCVCQYVLLDVTSNDWIQNSRGGSGTELIKFGHWIWACAGDAPQIRLRQCNLSTIWSKYSQIISPLWLSSLNIWNCKQNGFHLPIKLNRNGMRGWKKETSDLRENSWKWRPRIITWKRGWWKNLRTPRLRTLNWKQGWSTICRVTIAIAHSRRPPPPAPQSGLIFF